MSKKTTGKKSSAVADQPARNDASGNVDKIRDILFGGQMRDYDRRFELLEKRMLNENRRLSDDLQARCEQLDGYMREEFKSLSDRLANERKERTESGEDQSKLLGETRKAMEEKIADVDESLNVAAADIRNRLHEQGNELLELLRKSKEELSGSLHDETTVLRNDKVAREDLAAMFQEVALRLTHEFQLPEDD